MSFLVALFICLSLKFRSSVLSLLELERYQSSFPTTKTSPWMVVSRMPYPPPTTLSFNQFSTFTSTTVENCINVCSAANYIRAGLVAGSQCWCGNVIKPGNSGVSEGLCSAACTGNATEVCGVAHVRLCRDIPSARTLHHLEERSDSMTVQRCLDACLAQDFALAGLEYGSECWCGNADMYGRHRITPASSACNFPCAGNPVQICGGANGLNIYDRSGKGLTVGPPSPFTSPYNNTWFFNACVKCAADGWKVAGVEDGQECWCGSPPGRLPTSILAPLSDCVEEGGVVLVSAFRFRKRMFFGRLTPGLT
ncbi:uncharacterized protein LACBIDRAFT_335035 [Laccaria bicolor S238N-H82]|uniref:Predicted protein n=1 Tax=Laccaria bicolor (strain S238N-H82 / ATCC MYA-4686) TaxID=486041 RepID=B0E155_LACBS|nr:uncharacterized protein LACBIDRAFT_335035 [Laccaria bicolor S238N-H82]EDQ99397.1 predicted protein [Laccaria bicolor S238N-H82]|eukprot:XP_001889948.1 predicted protein [Laccaria bicolor S238N-H82]